MNKLHFFLLLVCFPTAIGFNQESQQKSSHLGYFIYYYKNCGFDISSNIYENSFINTLSYNGLEINDTIKGKRFRKANKLVHFIQKGTKKEVLKKMYTIHIDGFDSPPYPYDFFRIFGYELIKNHNYVTYTYGKYDSDFIKEHANTFKEKVFYFRLKHKIKRASKEAFRYFYKRHKALMDSLKVN